MEKLIPDSFKLKELSDVAIDVLAKDKDYLKFYLEKHRLGYNMCIDYINKMYNDCDDLRKRLGNESNNKEK